MVWSINVHGIIYLIIYMHAWLSTSIAYLSGTACSAPGEKRNFTSPVPKSSMASNSSPSFLLTHIRNPLGPLWKRVAWTEYWLMKGIITEYTSLVIDLKQQLPNHCAKINQVADPTCKLVYRQKCTYGRNSLGIWQKNTSAKMVQTRQNILSVVQTWVDSTVDVIMMTYYNYCYHILCMNNGLRHFIMY